MLLQPVKAPKVIAFATDAAHAAHIHDQARMLLPGCHHLHVMLRSWESAEAGVCLIVLVPLDATLSVRVFIAEGREALRRQILRAVRSLHGGRTAWVRGLDDPDNLIVMRALAENCATVEPRTLADVEAEGHA